MSKLEPTEAQRKAMAEATEAWNWYSCGPERRLDMVDDMIAAANSIPEGAPVGTVKQRPDGTFVAVRCGDVSPHPASWVYVRVMPGACEEPYGDDADSWPSYGEITPEPEGCGIGLDGECEGKCRKGYAPVGTIARRPDGAWKAERKAGGAGPYWHYSTSAFWRADSPDWNSEDDADSWPVIYDPTKRGPEIPPLGFFPGELPDPTDHPSREELQEYFHKDLAEHCQADDPDEYPDEYHEGDKPRLERLMREPSVFDGDADEVEELAKWLSIHLGTWPEEEWGRRVKPNYYHDRAQELLDFGYRKVSDPTAQQEPAYTAAAASEEMAKYWDNSIVTTTKREPRVVDRLGVDEQGSRWRNWADTEFWFQDECWNSRTRDGQTSSFGSGYEPRVGIFTEVLS